MRYINLYSDINGKPHKVTTLEDVALSSIDGSSIPYFQKIENSDLIIKKDNSFDFGNDKEVRRVFSIYNSNGKRYSKDPRSVLIKVLNDVSNNYNFKAGVELEFFILNEKGEPIDNFGYQGTIHPEMKKLVNYLERNGIPIFEYHHEVSNGQYEINLEKSNPLFISDEIMIIRDLINQYNIDSEINTNKVHISFMPKPFVNKNGNGMHIHLSMWEKINDGLKRGNVNVFAIDEDILRYFIGGILDHSKSIAAILAPTVNSYKRLIPNSEAPTKITYGDKNRSCLIRIPYSSNKDGKRIEIRMPDGYANPYLSFAAIIVAGMDGIDKKISPGEPLSENAYGIHEIESLPITLEKALLHLEEDLVIKSSLGEELISLYIRMKRKEWKDFFSSNVWNKEEITRWELDNYL